MELGKIVKEFEENGFAVVENFLSDDEICKLKSRMGEIVRDMDPTEHPISIFTTNNNEKRNEYFLNSSDKVRFFYEEDAFGENGELVVDKSISFNKVGHALHVQDDIFHEISFSPKVKTLLKALNFVKPALIQSMYIFKQPKIGGDVTAHYDSTFLRLDDMNKLVGLWIALDDASQENGCMWFIPGSHKEKRALYHFARSHGEGGKLLSFEGQKPDMEDSRFVPAPVKRGTCVLIHGLVYHKSEKNKSDKSRHAYACHIIERSGTEYHPDNWLQETETYKFPLIYDGLE